MATAGFQFYRRCVTRIRNSKSAGLWKYQQYSDLSFDKFILFPLFVALWSSFEMFVTFLLWFHKFDTVSWLRVYPYTWFDSPHTFCYNIVCSLCSSTTAMSTKHSPVSKMLIVLTLRGFDVAGCLTHSFFSCHIISHTTWLQLSNHSRGTYPGTLSFRKLVLYCSSSSSSSSSSCTWHHQTNGTREEFARHSALLCTIKADVLNNKIVAEKSNDNCCYNQ